MKYPKIYNMFLQALEYKRKNLKEENDITPSSKKSLKKSSETLEQKRKKLKDIYRKTLQGTPFEKNIPMFTELIDQVPEDYIDYELGINLDAAAKMVGELIHGKGDFTADEIQNIKNITRGVGIPAIEQHATGKSKMSKSTAKFGSDAINRNAKEFNDSMKRRRNAKYQLDSPKGSAIVKTERGVARRDAIATISKMLTINLDPNSRFGKTASKLQSKGINVERLVRSIKNVEKYTDAKKRAETELKRQGKSIEDLRGTDDLYNLFYGIKKAKETVRKER